MGELTHFANKTAIPKIKAKRAKSELDRALQARTFIQISSQLVRSFSVCLFVCLFLWFYWGGGGPFFSEGGGKIPQLLPSEIILRMILKVFFFVAWFFLVVVAF